MVAELEYTPAPDFQEQAEESLIDIDSNDSTELWLIQLPDDHAPDFDGQELSLDLHQDGQLGSLKGSSGKLYNFVSYSSRERDATVFASSPSGGRIAGMISRRVSLVHYPEPGEHNAPSAQRGSRGSRSLMTHTSLHQATPSRSTMSKRSLHSQSRSRSTHSRKSSLTDNEDISKPQKRTGQSVSTISGSSEQSEHKKSKR